MGQEQWFCLFRGDAGPMAVSAESVAEVIETESLVQLAWSPPQVVGLCPYHRDVVPVIRLAPWSQSAGADPASEPDRASEPATSGEEHDVEDRKRWVLLILKTTHGAWGIPGESVWTIMSREDPESLPPQTGENGPVLVGIIPHAGTRYGILDAEATWLGLRCAISRWYGFIGEPELSPPSAAGEEPRPPALSRRARSGES
jgi:chemotaxis signal transduction protein